MKIYVDKIPPEGLELHEQIDPQKISLELESRGISFTESVDVRAKVTRAGTEVFADVALEVPVEYTCSRCLVKFQDVFTKKINASYEVRPGDVVNIDDDIRQEIILDYPMKVLCSPDCKGLCPNCGQNLNISKCECNMQVT